MPSLTGLLTPSHKGLQPRVLGTPSAQSQGVNEARKGPVLLRGFCRESKGNKHKPLYPPEWYASTLLLLSADASLGTNCLEDVEGDQRDPRNTAGSLPRTGRRDSYSGRHQHLPKATQDAWTHLSCTESRRGASEHVQGRGLQPNHRASFHSYSLQLPQGCEATGTRA